MTLPLNECEQGTSEESKTNKCPQIIATCIVAIGPLATGIGKGYSSPALASMLLNQTLSLNGTHNNELSVNSEQGSWIVSLSLLGAFFGGVPGYMAMGIGRKRVLFVVSFLLAPFWLLTTFASCIEMIYVSSFLCGVCSAVIAVVTPVYISEISVPKIRGVLCSAAKLSANVGMLISFSLGAYLDWRKLALAASTVPVLLFILILFIPETPSYLLYKRKETEAKTSLRWLRGSSDTSSEFLTMKANIYEIKKDEKFSFLPLLRRDLLHPILITCGLMILSKFNGAVAFNFYAVPILSKTFVQVNPYIAAIVVVSLQILAGMVSSLLIDNVGRLPLLVFSTILSSGAFAGFGTYIYLIQHHTLARSMEWIPMTCVLTFQVAYALGISTIAWIYIAELFPLNHRGLGALANSISYASSFINVKTFVHFEMIIGLHGVFFVYAALGIISLLFIVSFVPETKNQSLQEMKRHYSHSEMPALFPATNEISIENEETWLQSRS